MKKLAILLTLMLVVTSVAVTGCGRAAANTDSLPRPVPHNISMGLENCNVCHIADQLSVTSISHADFTNDTCAQAGCHGERVYARPNPNPSPISRDIPHAVTFPLDNCTACHLTSKTGSLIPHSDFDGSMCLTPGCHRVASDTPTTPTPPPVTTIDTPTGPGEPTTSPTAEPTSGGNVLDMAPLSLNSTTHPSAYAAVCTSCHMADYPTAPSWAGSSLTPGPWVVVANSNADHTGRTDNAGCMVAGCHSW
ncbi:MAG: hypothetical protein FWH51_03875 [Dehalococcoidia bacterium]|nr:hypothetical protein [Dehalococcoidia bacterium]